MVGVPGRSKACLTCKKRRVACDLQHPKCGQCTRSRRECIFTQRHIFVLNDEGSHNTRYRKSAKAVESENSGSSAFPVRAEALPVPPTEDPAFTPDNLAISRSLSTFTALKQQLVAAAYCDTGQPSLDSFVSRPWTFTLSTFAGSAHDLKSAPLACYTAWIGRQKDEPYFIEVSRRLYVQGLRELQAAVNDATTTLLDETLGACLALIIYEALECPNSSRLGYAAHVDGCARLVKLRGTAAHQQGAAHDLFRAFRYIGLLNDLESHRPSFLSTPAWLNFPWQYRPKTMHDLLLDILAEAPEVLQKSDQLVQQPPHLFLSAILELVDDVRSTNAKLLRFYKDLEQISVEPLFWEETPRLKSLADDQEVLPAREADEEPVYNFKDLETARILTMYWSMLALSFSGMTDLNDTLSSMIAANAVPPALFQRDFSMEPQDWRDPVRKVCRSVRYCNAEALGGLGPLRLAVPLDIVIDVMRHRKGCEKEYAMATAAAADIRAKWLRVNQYRGRQDLT